MKKAAAGRGASKASKDSAKEKIATEKLGKDDKLNVTIQESEETNKCKTMPQSSDKKSGDASNGSQVLQQEKVATPVNQKKEMLQDAVMKVNNIG